MIARILIVLIHLLAAVQLASCKESKEAPRFGDVVISVTGEDKAALANMEVTLLKTGGEDDSLLDGITNASGNAEFLKLSPGVYKVTVAGESWVTASQELTVNPGESKEMTFTLSKPFDQLRILSYNVLQGFKNDDSKKNAFVEWVEEQEPDIICYQELNGFTQASFEIFAARLGHSYAVISKETGYPVGISSKYPITNVKRIMDGMVHGCLSAKIKDLNIVAVHLSPTTLDSRLKEIEQLMKHEASLPVGALTLFAGDFNSYSEFDSQVYGASFREDMIARNPNTPVDFTVTNTLKMKGYREAYPLFHHEYKRTLPTQAFLKPNDRGCRYDYIFLSEALSAYCTGAEIVHDQTTHYLSDHYPVIIDLKK